ncbi:MAG: response regulator transcription factor [Oscillospiraceae bacterium]|jgi:two-component system OmpR family response regulator|nr:response regulator transcription factor [Oscillospiraceae bacterium]MDE6997833.1 response regulator transcription factor [Oscillospiraceae bacterium]
MSGPLIAIVDDDVYIGDMLEELLVREGCRVMRAYSGTEALLLLGDHRPDLVLLDLMLPGLSGEDVLPHLAGIPVIVLSAKVDVEEKVSLLLGGAADYLTKPFDTRELLARIAVQLRSGSAEQGPSGLRPDLLRHKNLTLDITSRVAEADGTQVRLTRTEFAILKLLMMSPRQVIPKSRLLDQLSMETPDCVESSLKVHVSNLRRKLREAGAGECIEAVWGIGFKLAE